MVDLLSPAQVADLVSSQPDVDLVDVREPHEWVTGHLPGARLVPLDQFRADPDSVLVRGRTIVFVCAKGVRSLTAAKLAERLGYDRIANLEGGTLAWARAGLPIVTERRAAA